MYFVPDSFEDLQNMCSRGDSESATLEFKSSRLFSQKNEKVFETLSKELTAFANSIGGVLIVGAEENSQRVFSDITPILDDKKDESWIEDGLLSRISPKLNFSINKIKAQDGFLLVIDVPASRNAPHQASDKRYYARRLYRVDQLLAYEIDDIRRRSVAIYGGAKLSLVFNDGRINFEIENKSIGPVFDIWIEIEGIESSAVSNEWSPALARPYTEPFKIIQPEEKRNFLGASFQFFHKHLKDEMIVKLHYLDEDGEKHEEKSTYYLKDFESATIQRTQLEVFAEQGVSTLKKLEKAISKLTNEISDIKESAFFPTGLNLSETTLSVLAGDRKPKWPGESMSYLALAEILEVDINVAIEIQQTIFAASHIAGGKDLSLEESNLPDEVKKKIASRLKLSKSLDD